MTCLDKVGLSTMLEAAKYSAIERLRDGRMIEIRTLTPEDKPYDFFQCTPRPQYRSSGAYPVAVLGAARWVESSSSVCRAIISSSFVGIT